MLAPWNVTNLPLDFLKRNSYISNMKKRPSSLPAQPNHSLIDGLSVLSHLAVSREPSGVTEIANTLSFDITRVNRILKTLAHLGFAYRTKSRKYTAGSGMHVLAAQALFGSGYLRRALPHLKKLTGCGHTVAFGVLWGMQVSYLFHWNPGLPLEDAFGRLSTYPAEQSSIGCVLLAQKSNSEIPASIKKNKTAMENIGRARTRGYGEVIDHDRSIGLAVGNPPYAALGVSGQIRDADVSPLLELMTTAKKNIESAMAARE